MIINLRSCIEKISLSLSFHTPLPPLPTFSPMLHFLTPYWNGPARDVINTLSTSKYAPDTEVCEVVT